MFSRLIGSFGVITALAAGYTGLRPWWIGSPPFLFFTNMTGFLPPHYGYSAYVASAGVWLAPWPWARWVCAVAVLLSVNRAAMVGLIAGWAYAGGRRRLVLAAILACLTVVGGMAAKQSPQPTRNDSVRIQIWKAAIGIAKANPGGIGRGQFAVGVAGRAADKAHSDVLQATVEYGFARAFVVILAAGLGIWLLPRCPAKITVVTLVTQSVFDNRLHHPVCAAVLVGSVIAAVSYHTLTDTLAETSPT